MKYALKELREFFKEWFNVALTLTIGWGIFYLIMFLIGLGIRS